MPDPTATPNILTDPGYLFIAPLGSTMPTNTVVGSVFTDEWAAAWIPLGATEDGSEFAYSSTVEPITVAELFDPVAYRTTGRTGRVAFNLADWTLSMFRRAINGGLAPITATSGTGATTLGELEPPDPGTEVRAMIGWESLDNTTRLVARQCLQGGEVTSAFRRAPSKAVIPCTFQMEKPASAQPWIMFSAGAERLGAV